MVRVRAIAAGYVSEEKAVVLGSMQENAVASRATNITSTDRVVFTLKKREAAAAAPSVIIEVAEADGGKPIPNASVVVEYILGTVQVIGQARTGFDGRTKPVTLKPQQPGEIHTHYRVRAVAEGFKLRFSDIPDEMIRPGPPRTYVVHLDRSAPKPGVADFSGNWDTMVGRLGYPRALTLTQTGNTVTGTYTHRTGSGTLEGTVTGNTFKYRWKEKEWAGEGEFSLRRDGQVISGTYTEPGQPPNIWSGSRRK